jgi:hypothetical protein
MWKRNVFCAVCYKQIDVHTSPDKEPNAMAEAMCCGEARRAHQQQTGCHGLGAHGEAWYFDEPVEIE